jgi:integrase
LPVVLSRDEIVTLLNQLTGTERLIVMLLYGSGVRLEECLELRVKDLDFDRHQIIVRQGKGQKDRVTMLPVATRETLTGIWQTCAGSMRRIWRAGSGGWCCRAPWIASFPMRRRVAMAVRVFGRTDLPRSTLRIAVAVSRAPVCRAEGHGQRGTAGRDHEAPQPARDAPLSTLPDYVERDRRLSR